MRAEEAEAAKAKLERAYWELAVLERTRNFAFTLFKDVFQPLLEECDRRTIRKIKKK